MLHPVTGHSAAQRDTSRDNQLLNTCFHWSAQKLHPAAIVSEVEGFLSKTATCLLFGTHFPPASEQFCWPRGADQQEAAVRVLQGAESAWCPPCLKSDAPWEHCDTDNPLTYFRAAQQARICFSCHKRELFHKDGTKISVIFSDIPVTFTCLSSAPTGHIACDYASFLSFIINL